MSTEIKKISAEELEKLRNLQKAYSEITAKFGQLKIEQILVQDQLNKLNDLNTQFESEYKAIQASEIEYLKSLEAVYGKVNVNIETGEISS